MPEDVIKPRRKRKETKAQMLKRTSYGPMTPLKRSFMNGVSHAATYFAALRK